MRSKCASKGCECGRVLTLEGTQVTLHDTVLNDVDSDTAKHVEVVALREGQYHVSVRGMSIIVHRRMAQAILQAAARETLTV